MPYECNDNVPALGLRHIVEYSENSGVPLIIGADCNAHHAVWGSTDINRRGEKLVEYIATTNLEVLNKGNKPTFVVKNRKEVIDVTFASQCITEKVYNWHVSDEETLSDHKR